MPVPAEFSCPNGSFVEPGQDFVAAHVWGGKRLFTPTDDGGQITNRFFPSVSESRFGEFLVYDECRGLQTGIWTCNANADIVKPDGQRKLFQFGWMMWQSIDPDVAAFEAWERANPEWTKPESYGFPTDPGPHRKVVR